MATALFVLSAGNERNMAMILSRGAYEAMSRVAQTYPEHKDQGNKRRVCALVERMEAARSELQCSATEENKAATGAEFISERMYGEGSNTERMHGAETASVAAKNNVSHHTIAHDNTQETRAADAGLSKDTHTGVERECNECSFQCCDDVCVACGKSAVDVGKSRLMKCSACTIAPMYCSSACQQACWPAHKAECKANRKASK